MQASFRAYVDESGDEGFVFRTSPPVQASSDWFVLAAFVTRKKTDLETVKIVDRARKELQRHPKKHIHWKDLKHAEKVRYAQLISELPARTVAVCVHKPSLLEPETFRERYRLYFYAVRYLVERVSWLARDKHNPAKWGGDGTVELVFSNRQGMSYAEMKDYLQHLEKQKSSGQDIRVEFGCIPTGQLTTDTPGRCMGLQLADAVAGAIFNALERDRFGNTEARYLKILSPILYGHDGRHLGYGLKIVPRETFGNWPVHKDLEWLR
jgi:hypothetical protein